MDWFVLANLGFLFLMFGFFAGCAWMIWRRTTKPEPHMQLIMELQEQNEAAYEDERTKAAATEEREPWQRADDWWKQ